MWEGTPMVLLHHTGAKSGRNRVTPVAYLSDGGRYVVIASNGGAPTSPDWYHNLKAHPNITIKVGTATIDVAASEATGEERERLFRTQAERFPQLSEHEQKTERLIPVLGRTTAAGTRRARVVPSQSASRLTRNIIVAREALSL